MCLAGGLVAVAVIGVLNVNGSNEWLGLARWRSERKTTVEVNERNKHLLTECQSIPKAIEPCHHV